MVGCCETVFRGYISLYSAIFNSRMEKFIRVFYSDWGQKTLSFTFGASSIQPAPCELRQGRKAAAVAGRSGVIWVACPIFLSCLFFDICSNMVCMNSGILNKKPARIHSTAHNPCYVQSLPIGFKCFITVNRHFGFIIR